MDIYLSLIITLLVSILAGPVFANQSDRINHTVPVRQIVNATNLVHKGTLANVNINTADAETLAQELDGIGPKRAQLIVAYREEHGPFKSIEDLLKVKGIGKKTIDKNRDKIIV